jgi:hypothetical protein
LQQVLEGHALEVPDCRDLSHAYRDVADGLWFDDSVPLINHDDVIIQKGIIFKTMKAMKIWLAEYAVFHLRTWTIRARKEMDGNWRITSLVQPHTWFTNVDDRKHTQLSSRFISQRLFNIIKNYPLMTVTALIKVVMVTWGILCEVW